MLLRQIAANEPHRQRRRSADPSTGRGMPDICFGSGICDLRRTTARTPRRRRQSTQQKSGRSAIAVRPSAHRSATDVHRRVHASFVPAALAEPRVGVVRGRAASRQIRRRRARLPSVGRRLCIAQALRQIALDLRPVAGAGVQLPHQPRRARPQACSDISRKSSSDTFPIARSNSSSLIVRSVSIFSRSSAARVRWPITTVRSSCAETSGRTVRSAARPTSAVGAHQHAQQDDRRDALAADQERDRRRAAERRQDEELPGLKAGFGSGRRLRSRADCRLAAGEPASQSRFRSSSSRRSSSSGSAAAPLRPARSLRLRDHRTATTPTHAAAPAPTDYGSSHASRLKPSSIGAPSISWLPYLVDERLDDLVARSCPRRSAPPARPASRATCRTDPCGTRRSVACPQPPQVQTISCCSCFSNSVRA